MNIEQARALGHVICYHPAIDAGLLKPAQTLERSIEHVNQCLNQQGRDPGRWAWGDQDEATRLVRVNWMYQNLQREPIRKPMLVNSRFEVMCGDTRLMTLNLLPTLPTVSVVLYCRPDQTPNRSGWVEIKTDQDLIQCAGFGSDAAVLITADSNSITWLEIGDATTAHHLHDHDLRIRMLQKYLQQQPPDWKFSVAWCRESIDWFGLV